MHAVATFSELFARLDPDPRVRGKQFEHVCKWFLTNDPTYKNTLRRVWLWREWTGRWGADAGIDLVAEDHDGRLWAIQAKAYAPQNTVTKADVDKFLAESSRAVFSYRLLIATTDKLHHVARRTINDQEKQVAFVGLSDLLTSQLNWHDNPLDMRPLPPPKPAKPREHQREAIRDVVKGFTKADRGQLIMACGTGKTLTSLFIKEKLDAERALVLVPSLSLLKQTMQVWTVNRKLPFEPLPVCSDQTVGRSGEDAAVAHTSELGVPVTTNAGEIATFLRRSGPRVVFSTYQSSPQIAEAFALGRVPAFDLVVADEAHRVAGVESSDFATVLDKTAIATRRRLFMTATPRYFTGRVLKAAQEADLEVASMDDPSKFGTVFHRLTFSEAINRDLLTDYQVAVVGVDNDTYREWADEGTLVTRDGKKITDARTLAGQIGLAKSMRKYDLHRTISFHSRVDRAREFVAEMPEVIAWMPASQRPKGALWARHASGEMSAGERHVLLQHLSRLDDGERGLLTNARCLSEGVDVPTLDGVAFIDPRRSEVDIVQAVGRAIRCAPDKTIGTVVIPVFIDTDEDPETALDDSAFKPVWDVIKALRSHDVGLGEELDELRRQLGRQRGRPHLPRKIHLDLPLRIGTEFAHAFDVRLVEQTTASWEFWFGVLQQFIESHGHARISDDYTVDGYRLGKWVQKQRSKQARGTLDADRQQRLQDLQGWTWDPFADQWEEGFSRLLDYVKSHHDARMPQAYTVDGYRLGAWIDRQRGNYAQGTLDADRQHRLEELPGWTWTSRADQWEEGFSRLVLYVKSHGNSLVPRSHTVDGYQLGAWVTTQRGNYAKGTLSTDRERRLQELPGWAWNSRTERWDEGYGRLLSYVKRHGNALVPASHSVDGFKLGAWVVAQRVNYLKGILQGDRRLRLEELPGWTWKPIAAQWEEGFSRLLEYVECHGDARVPARYIFNSYKLGNWVAAQRDSYAEGTLNADREHRLQELPGWTWNRHTDQWEEGFSRLRDYVDRHGDAHVPYGYTVDGYKLGAWVRNQRSRRSTLDSERRCRLEALGGWVWDTQSAKWDENFSRLLDYVNRNGDARVPFSYTVDGYKLGTWINTQRVNHANGTLGADRERRLQELPGWTWDARADRALRRTPR
jgi:superfamily II DNA or RNA helicase